MLRRKKRVDAMEVGAITLTGKGANPDSKSFLLIQSEAVAPDADKSAPDAPEKTPELLLQEAYEVLRDSEDTAARLVAVDQISSSLRVLVQGAPEDPSDELAVLKQSVAGWDVLSALRDGVTAADSPEKVRDEAREYVVLLQGHIEGLVEASSAQAPDAPAKEAPDDAATPVQQTDAPSGETVGDPADNVPINQAGVMSYQDLTASISSIFRPKADPPVQQAAITKDPLLQQMSDKLDAALREITELKAQHNSIRMVSQQPDGEASSPVNQSAEPQEWAVISDLVRSPIWRRNA